MKHFRKTLGTVIVVLAILTLISLTGEDSVNIALSSITKMIGVCLFGLGIGALLVLWDEPAEF